MSAPPLRGWARLKQRALATAQPLSAYLELTYRCNWRCAFCYNPRHADRRGLSAPEWTRVLDDLRSLGTLSVTLTGGEPLAHPGFLEVAQAASARRFAVRIFTNGTLVSDEVADAIAAVRPLAVEMSLHGETAQTHERATGAPGSFAAMLAGLERLARRGVPLRLKSLLTSLNEHELDGMIALAKRLGVEHQVDANITPRDDGDLSPLRLRPSDDAVRRMYRHVAEQGVLPRAERTAGAANCGLGRVTLAIDPEGEVFPCLQWRRTSLGNVRETPLRELWERSAERRDAAAVAVAANDRLLAAGGPVAAFPFCPALAAQRGEDPLEPDEDHRRHASIVAALRDGTAAG